MVIQRGKAPIRSRPPVRSVHALSPQRADKSKQRHHEGPVVCRVRPVRREGTFNIMSVWCVVGLSGVFSGVFVCVFSALLGFCRCVGVVSVVVGVWGVLGCEGMGVGGFWGFGLSI